MHPEGCVLRSVPVLIFHDCVDSSQCHSLSFNTDFTIFPSDWFPVQKRCTHIERSAVSVASSRANLDSSGNVRIARETEVVGLQNVPWGLHEHGGVASECFL